MQCLPASTPSVYIASNGAVVVDNIISIDGYNPGSIFRVTTHVHVDHSGDIGKSLREVAASIATPLTHELISIYVRSIPPSKRVDAGYHTPLGLEDYRITLLQANHVPGAAEVLVEAPNGVRVLYTGDFKLPGTEIVEDVDVLVIDATYGVPEWTRPWQYEMEYLLPDLVNEGLMRGPVYIYAYNGKVEEVAVLLRRMGVSAPFIVDSKRYRSLRLIERFGFTVGDIVRKGSRDALEAQRSGWFVEFRSFSAWRRANGSRGLHMLLTGWEFRAPYRRIDGSRVIVSFSDHADFSQLVEYVEKTRPRLLLVDSARGGEAARVFAEYARKKLGLNAVPCPG